jgi:hypothetical protein
MEMVRYGALLPSDRMVCDDPVVARIKRQRMNELVPFVVDPLPPRRTVPSRASSRPLNLKEMVYE